MLSHEDRISRLEHLLAQLAATAAGTASNNPFVTTQFYTPQLPNNNVNTVIGSVNILVPHPILIFVLFMVKDRVQDKMIGTQLRVYVDGEAVAPVTAFNAAAANPAFTQAGFANTPTLQVAISLDGKSLQALAQNPIAANPIDVEVTFQVLVSQAGT
jgi:hypothetical protein